MARSSSPSTSCGSHRRWLTLGGEAGMWDEEDGFYYDVLRLPQRPIATAQGSVHGLHLLPPCAAATVFEGGTLAKYPEVGVRLKRFLEARPEVHASIHDPRTQGFAGRRLASILDETKLRRVLGKLLDESEFLSPFGIRSSCALSRGASLCLQCGRARLQCVLPARGVRYRHVRRQLQLARADLDARERPDYSSIAPILPLLRQ